MKKLIQLLLCLLLVSGYLFLPFSAVKAHVPGGANLIANPSAETATLPSTPDKWTSNTWGTNTAFFSYENAGHTGARSLKTEVTAYTSGDAKWYFEPVAVTPNTSYTFGEFYKSNTATEVVIQYTTADNSNTYQWLGTLPVSTDWTDKDFTFTTPGNATKLSVFHVVASVGWLAIDDVSLVETPPETVPPSSSLVPNESVETVSAANPNAPAKWLTNSWGTNAPSFEYVNEGRTGGRSVKTTVANHTSGDAKWYFEPVAVNPSTDYTFTDYYKASVASHVVAVTYDNAGNPTYQDLVLSAPASPSAWQAVTQNFTTPANAKTMSIFHVVESNGWLQLDDMSVKAAEATPPPVNGNLITNPSLENGSGIPQAWASNTWGTNTASFSYENTGRTGNKSVKTTVASYTSGDAKWYFNPVTVQAGTTYTYSHYFKSNVQTQVVAQFTDQNGNASYQFLGVVESSNDWKAATYTFTAPANAHKASIFHVVASVGWLVIDDAFLAAGSAPNPLENPIPNQSVETAAGNQPAQWISSSWGTNTPVYEYVNNNGHDSNRSVKVTVSNYASGDAKWYFEPITTLERGKQYRFTAWYKGNVTPHPVAMYLKDDGSEQYFGMPVPLSNSTSQWQFYNETFTVPLDAKAVSVFFYVADNGWIQTDDYKIAPYQSQGFNRPLVTLTFDDGHEENHINALPIMESYGFDSTQCYATTFIENASNQQLAINNILKFKNAGHEICSHTVTHPFLTQLNLTQLTFELGHSKEYLESVIGVPIRNFASPYGDYNAAVNTEIKKYYQSHRTVDEGYNSKDNFDIYRLRVQNMLSSTTIEEYQSWLDHAAATNTWLILVYHRVASDPGAYDTFTNDFAQQMAVLSASGLTVKTYQQALDEILPQL